MANSRAVVWRGSPHCSFLPIAPPLLKRSCVKLHSLGAFPVRLRPQSCKSHRLSRYHRGACHRTTITEGRLQIFDIHPATWANDCYLTPSQPAHYRDRRQSHHSFCIISYPTCLLPLRPRARPPCHRPVWLAHARNLRRPPRKAQSARSQRPLAES